MCPRTQATPIHQNALCPDILRASIRNQIDGSDLTLPKTHCVSSSVQQSSVTLPTRANLPRYSLLASVAD